MTRPSDWCWCIWCWRRGSGGLKETREYRFGGTAMITNRALTVARSDTAVTRWPPPSASSQLMVRTGLLRTTSSPSSARLQQGDLLHPADDPLVQDEVLVGQVGEGSGGGGHQHRLQRGEGVGGLGEHAAGDEQANVVAGFLVAGVPAEPVVEGDGVQLARLGVRPGLGGADFGGERVQHADELVHFAAVASLTGKESPV